MNISNQHLSLFGLTKISNGLQESLY